MYLEIRILDFRVMLDISGEEESTKEDGVHTFQMAFQ